MKELIQAIVGLAAVLFWLAGIVFSKGWLLTAVAICMPPYAWYLVVEHAMRAAGLVP